MLNLITSKDKN